MSHFFHKLFNIRSDEWKRFLLIYLMYLIMLSGFTWAEAIVEAAFLRQVGIEFLPLAIIGNGLFSIIGIIIYTAFADRVDNGKLLIGLSLVSVAGIALGLGFLGLGLTAFAYPLFYMIINVALRDIFNVHWPTYVNGFYDTRAAKRIIPVLGSGARVVGILAGVSMPLLNRLLSPGGIILIWLVTVAAMAVITHFIPIIMGDPAPEAKDKAGSSFQKAFENIRQGYRYVSKSTYLHWMALATFATMVLLAFVNYQTGKVMLAELHTVEQISNFTAMINSVANLVMLPFQLFLLTRLISAIGLGNTALIFPSSLIAACTSLMLAPGLFSAALGNLSRNTFRTTFRNPTDNLLYNAVPVHIKARARAFIAGLVVPMGSLCGGLLLLAARHQASFAAWFLPGLIVVLSIVQLVSTLAIRRQYPKALLEMLEREDYSSLVSATAGESISVDPAALAMLEEKFNKPGADKNYKIFVAQLIGQVGGRQAAPILVQAARAADDARIRQAIVDILVSAEIFGDSVLNLFCDLLCDPDSQVRKSAIGALERFAGLSEEQLLLLASTMLEDPDAEVLSRALSVFAASGTFFNTASAAQVLDQLLEDPLDHNRALGVEVLSRICTAQRDENQIERLLTHTEDSSDEVRTKAALALETLVNGQSGNLPAPSVFTKSLKTFERLLEDPVERIRKAVVHILETLDESESIRLLVLALSDSSPAVRSVASDALVGFGKTVIPVLHPELESPNQLLQKMATITLGRLNPLDYSHLIDKLAKGNLMIIYKNFGYIDALKQCGKYQAVGILEAALSEQNKYLTDEIFYFLSAIHDPSSIKAISHSIRSHDPLIRANAIETLESLTTSQITRLIAPIFEPDSELASLVEAGKAALNMERSSSAGALRQLAAHPDNPCLRSAAIFALGEMGAELCKEAVSAPQLENREAPRGRRNRGESMDLLNKLTDTSDKPMRRKRSSSLDLLGKLVDMVDSHAPSSDPPLTLEEIESMLTASFNDPVEEVRLTAQNSYHLILMQKVA